MQIKTGEDVLHIPTWHLERACVVTENTVKLTTEWKFVETKIRIQTGPIGNNTTRFFVIGLFMLQLLFLIMISVYLYICEQSWAASS